MVIPREPFTRLLGEALREASSPVRHVEAAASPVAWVTRNLDYLGEMGLIKVYPTVAMAHACQQRFQIARRMLRQWRVMFMSD